VLTSLLTTLPALAATYRLDYATLDGGGGLTTSARYSHSGSLGSFGGPPSTASHTTLRPGFLGQLNDPPIPGTDLLRRPARLSTKVTLDSLIANDTDPEGGPLTLTSIDSLGEAGGSVASDAGWLLFEPDASDSPADAFHYLVADAEGDLAVVRVEVTTPPPSLLQTRNLLAISALPGGALRIDFIGIPARRYRIEWTASLNPPSWQFLGSIDADPSGLFSFIDPPEHALRFYRAVAE
jgi:hypothetical protein